MAPPTDRPYQKSPTREALRPSAIPQPPLPFPGCTLPQSSDPDSLPGSPKFPATPAPAAHAPPPPKTPPDYSRESLPCSPKAKSVSARKDTKSPAAPAPAQASRPLRETMARATPHRETLPASAICSGKPPPPPDGCKSAPIPAPHKPPQPPADRPAPKSRQRAARQGADCRAEPLPTR